MHSHRPETLARGAEPARPGTLHARSVIADISVPPVPGRVVRFGRGGRPDVDLSVAEGDLRVSRRHGELTYHEGKWWLRNTGQQLVRLPRGRMMHASSGPLPLETGYTPLFVRGSGYREHLVELYVTDHDERGSGARRDDATLPPKRWPLDDEERLLLVVLGQHYLLYEECPRPLSYRQAAVELAYVCGEGVWGERRIERKVGAVRRRIERGGDFPYSVLREDDGAGPSDHNLLHNLLRGLVESTTLVPPDLELLDGDLDA
jgi:hypothetical protein